jgi:uncharacterized protein YbjT (DUF2867 family)
LTEALQGVQVVIDLTNSPSFEDAAVMNFFQASARNLFPAERAAGVQHHVALSVVGADRMVNLGYMRAKVAQEEAIKASGIAYTIVRATQFFEFIGSLADAATDGQNVRLSSVEMQPLAADDIASAVATIALQAPMNGYINVAGPERRPMNDFARELLQFKHDPRQVITAPGATYFGGEIPSDALFPHQDGMIGSLRFSEWLTHTQTQTK